MFKRIISIRWGSVVAWFSSNQWLNQPLQYSMLITGISGWTSWSRARIPSGLVWKFAVWRTPGRVPPCPSPEKWLSDVKCRQSSPFSRNTSRTNWRYSLLTGLKLEYSFSIYMGSDITIFESNHQVRYSLYQNQAWMLFLRLRVYLNGNDWSASGKLQISN